MIRRREERPTVATREMARRRRRRRALVALGVGIAVVAGTGYGAWRFIDENEYLLEERCSVSVGEQTHELTPEQTRSAAVLTAAAMERDLPPEAAVDAVAISLQENELTARQEDPEEAAAAEEAASEDEETPEPEAEYFARGGPQWDTGGGQSHSTPTTAGEFFDLLEDSEEWNPDLGLDESAELLERPHNPSFYPQHGEKARAFVAPLAGQQPVDMSCELSQLDVPEADPEGFAEELTATFPTTLGEDAAEISDDEVQVSVPEAENGENSQDLDYEWMLAHWAVAVARDYGIQTVAVGSYEWNRDDAAWQRQDPHTDAATVVIGFSRDGR